MTKKPKVQQAKSRLRDWANLLHFGQNLAPILWEFMEPSFCLSWYIGCLKQNLSPFFDCLSGPLALALLLSFYLPGMSPAIHQRPKSTPT